MAFPASYALYQEVTVDNTKVAATLTDFPVYIDLSDLVKAGNDLFDTCQADGGDIRVTLVDGTTELAREIVSIDTSAKTGEMHVNIPSLSSSADTVIKIWYNGSDTEPADDSTYGAENTWNSNYLMVQHMDDITTSTVIDSTVNDNDGSKSSVGNPAEIAGKIGNAQDFSLDTITISATAALRDLPITHDFTVSFWSRADIAGALNSGFSWSGTDDLIIYPNDNSDGSGGGKVFWRDIGAAIISEAGSDLSDTYYLTHFISRAVDDHELYRNAASVGTSAATGSAGPFTSVFIGDYVGQYFDGKIDEVRVLATALSVNWLTTEYNNQSSPGTFYTASDEESISVISAVSNAVVNETIVLSLSNHNISVVDSVAVTTSTLLNVDAGSVMLAVNIYDSVSINENISIDIPTPLVIAVNDTVIISEYNLLNQITSFGTDPRPDHYPKLPTVSCEAEFRETFVIESKVPVVSCSGYFGSLVTGEAPAPSAEITIKGLYAGYISVNSKVPVSEATGLFGSIVTGKAPTVSCSATLANRDITVSSYAPVVTAEIVIPNYFISIASYVPISVVSAVLFADGYISIASKVPAAFGSVIISKNITIAVIGISPVAEAAYNNIIIGSSSIAVTGTAPVVAIYKPTGEEDPGSISLSEQERFAAITLQYSRWPDAV